MKKIYLSILLFVLIVTNLAFAAVDMRDGDFFGIRPPDPVGFYVSGNSYYFKDSGFSKLQVNLPSGRFPGDVDEDVATLDGVNLVGCEPYTIENFWSNDISNVYWNKSIGVTITGTDGFQADSAFDSVGRSINTTDSLLYTLSFYDRVESGGQTTGYRFAHNSSESGETTGGLTLIETRKRDSITVLGKLGGGTVFFAFMDGNASDWSTNFLDTLNITQSPYALPATINNKASTLSIPANNSSNSGTQEGYYYLYADEPGLVDALDGVADGVDDWHEGTYTVTVQSDWTDNLDGTYTLASATGNPFVFLNSGGVIAPVGSNWEFEYELITAGSVEIHAGSDGAKVARSTVGIHKDRSIAAGFGNLYFESSTIGTKIRPISVKQISNAQGEIQFTWTPQWDKGDIGTDVNLFSTNNSKTIGCWYDDVNGLIKFSDGTNTVSVAHIADKTAVNISIVLDGANDQMVIGVGETSGTVGTFTGHVSLGDYFSYFWGAEYQKISAPKFYKKIKHTEWLP